MWADFKAFLLKENALALAIGVVVGGALNTVVKGLVDGLIMPLVAGIFSVASVKPEAWETIAWTLGPFVFKPGLVFSAVLNFLVIGFVAWRLSKIFAKPAAPAPAAKVKACPFCMKGDLDEKATRCPHCTGVLDAAALAGVPSPGGMLGGAPVPARG